MSSSLYFGVPGAGKSFGITRYVIVPALERGQRVVTNIPLNEAALCDYLKKNLDGLIKLVSADDIRAPNFWFTAEGLGDTVTQGGDCIVIDECHEFYGPEHKIKADNEVFRAIRFQRKYTGGEGNFSTDIIFATQDYGDVTKSIRNVCGSMYYMQKLLVVGKADTYRVDVFADARKSPERGKPATSMFGNYDPEFFNLYNSYSAGVGGFTSSAPGVEVITDDRLNVWNSTIGIGPIKLNMKQAKYVAIAVTVLSLLVLFFVFRHVMSRTTKPVAAPVTKVAPARAALPGQPAAPAANTGTTSPAAAAPAPSPKLFPNESSEYRLVGFYQLGENKLAVVVDTKGRYRYLQAGGFSDTDFSMVQAGPATHIKVKGQIIAPWTGASAIQGNSTSKEMEQTK